MPATVKRFRSRQQLLHRDQAEQLRQMLLSVAGAAGLPEGPVNAIISAVDRETAAENGGTFVMLSAAQNKAVIRWLQAHSERPEKAQLLWAEMIDHLRQDTCEVVLSRSEMASLIGALPRHVTEITAELESIGALSRRRDGRGVRYFMNPNVATHLPHEARKRAQAGAPLINPAVVKHRRASGKPAAAARDGDTQPEAGPTLRLVTT